MIVCFASSRRAASSTHFCLLETGLAYVIAVNRMNVLLLL